jgi:hypothetical protein
MQLMSFSAPQRLATENNDANVGVGIHTQQWRELEHL